MDNDPKINTNYLNFYLAILPVKLIHANVKHIYHEKHLCTFNTAFDGSRS